LPNNLGVCRRLRGLVLTLLLAIAIIACSTALPTNWFRSAEVTGTIFSPPAHTWIVDDDGPAHFHTIQEAINAANPEDTIYVKAGTYSEHVVVNKTVTLVGEEPIITIIDGGRTRNVITLTANNVTIKGFTIQNSGYSPYCGIYVYSNYSEIIDNRITNNGGGIYMSSSISNKISDNNIMNSETWGMQIVDSHSNTIINNIINNSGLQAIVISYSYGNTIYHNNFINRIQVLSWLSTNVWDDGYPSGGNYWSDYSDVDLFSGPEQDVPGSDGIWDHPYTIDANNTDRYPLVEPWTPTIKATIDIHPNALNLRSMGEWITCYIELPEGYNVSDIDIYSIRLNDTFPVSLLPKPPVPVPTEIGDYDNDTIPDLMVKFNMTELTSHIYHVLGIKHGNVTLTITGIVNETPFEGKDTIKVLLPGDIDCDGDVDPVDYILFIGSYGCSIGDQGYDPNADLESDGHIDKEDFMIFIGNYGTKL